LGCSRTRTRHNHAEREIRPFVLWCKRSFGSQSDRGNDFAVRIMSVTHTARKR
jgi:transposase